MMSGAKSQKPRCACTGVSLWLVAPPGHEHKSGAELAGQDCESAQHGTIRMKLLIQIISCIADA